MVNGQERGGGTSREREEIGERISESEDLPGDVEEVGCTELRRGNKPHGRTLVNINGLV